MVNAREKVGIVGRYYEWTFVAVCVADDDTNM